MSTIFYTNAFIKNNKIFYRGYQNGERFSDIIDDYRPYIFLPNKVGANSSKYQTIDGKSVYKHTFQSLKSAYETIKQYRETRTPYWGFSNFVYPFLNDYFPGTMTFDASLISVVSLDIEVMSKKGFPSIKDADQEINAITLVKKGKSITFGTKPYKTSENQTYVLCKDEAELLQQFLKYWNTEEWAPDIITGWSVEMFDIPYLYRRICNVLGKKAANKLSPFNHVEEREIIRGKSGTYFKTFDDRKEAVYDIYGISTLDYLQLYKKFTFTNHESYALKNIAKAELGETKLEYEGSLDDFYQNNPQGFIEYNIKDALLVEKLEDKLNFIQQVINIAYLAKTNYVDAFVTLRPWDVIIHNHLLEKNIAIPQYIESSEGDLLMGGYVKNPVPGMYKWVVSFDFDSLYPSILSQHNISPETYIKKVKVPSPHHIIRDNNFPTSDEGYIITGNGCTYRRDTRGFIPELVDLFIAKRKEIKKEMISLEKLNDKTKSKEVGRLDNYQKAVKIMTNALYGAISMKYFRYYSFDMAESVTSTSQLCTRYIERELNVYLNKLLGTKDFDYIIAADTDSVYVNLDPLVEKCGMADKPYQQIIEFIDQACQTKIELEIEKLCTNLCKMMQVYTPKLHMKRESIALKALWRAPKMYALNVGDKEGVRYPEPKIKLTGIEAVRASTPMICRDKIKAAINIIMNKDEVTLQKFVETFHNEYKNLPFSSIAFPRSVNGVKKYYDKNTLVKPHTPIHVRGAIVYNEAIKALELQKKYPLIRDKDKIKFVYLKTPNPFHSNVISAPDVIPKEFELDQYIDRVEQWNKTFLNPIESFTSIIGWNTKETSNLLEFIGA